MSTPDPRRPSWVDDGRLHFALGIEDTFVPQTRPGERAIDEYVLCEHDRFFARDFQLAAGVGAQLLRWGVPWYGVCPQPGVWSWDWTDRAMAALADAGIEPIVDLVHYGTPLWLEGSFANPNYPHHVAEFAARVADRYRGLARSYTPVNEPVIHALFCGEYGYWPPYLDGPDGFVRIAANIARGFVLTQRAIGDELGEDAIFVHVEAAMDFTGDDEAAEHRAEADRLRAQVYLVEDLVTGRVGPDHALRSRLLAGGVEEPDLEWFAERAVQPDVMGVNYYPRHSTELFETGSHHRGGFADPRPTVDRGAEGLEAALRRFADQYGAPVMLAETCVTGTVEERISWLDESITTLERLRADGVPVVGYTWWPLFDMYEWTWRHTELPRSSHLLPMGLFDLVESAEGLQRVRNPVADRYAHHAAQHSATHSAAVSPMSSPTSSNQLR